MCGILARLAAVVLISWTQSAAGQAAAGDAAPTPEPSRVRFAAAQPRSRLIEWRLRDPAAVLARVEHNLEELAAMIGRAAERGCRVIAFPEDTLGLGHWLAGNGPRAREVLQPAVTQMLARFGEEAARHRIYVICCNNYADEGGLLRNTAFFIGRDGAEIGRYHKVCPTLHERACTPGDRFPVFETPDLGGVGMLICYDMVFPETARALALGGADVIFHPTLGGAAIGDDDINRAAFRTRAVENFVYLVVAQRGNGSMILSPQGKILAEADGPDSLAVADIDPFGGREGGDAMNAQRDMRARLFRERTPAAFGILTDPNPPVLAKVPAAISEQEAIGIANRVLTVGEEEFKAADALARAGKTEEAIAAYQRLRAEYKDSWIDRVSKQRLARLQTAGEAKQRGGADEAGAAGIAAGYPGDAGIAADARVLFAEDFESGTLADLERRWSGVSNAGERVLAFSDDRPPASRGHRSLQMTATKGLNTGGHLYKQLERGVERLHLRFYVSISSANEETHHFVTLGGYRPATAWPQGGAGERPRGDDRVTVGIEPTSLHRRVAPSGAWNFYAYWHEMKVSADGKYWGQGISPKTPLLIPKDLWQCVEVMLKLNSTPEAADGELALWLDGRPAMRIAKGARRGPWTGMGFELLEIGGEEFEGFRWRTAADFKLNFVWLLHYVTDSRYQRTTANRVRFDDVVAATDYIGPIRPR